MEEEIVPRYPEHAATIRQFSEYLRRSVHMGTVLLLLITIFGGVLMWYSQLYLLPYKSKGYRFLW